MYHQVTASEGEKNKATCFHCKGKGHFAKSCAATPVGTTQPLTVPSTKTSAPCPKCRQRYHWANPCTVKTDVEGLPVPERPLAGPALAPPNKGVLSSILPSPICLRFYKTFKMTDCGPNN